MPIQILPPRLANQIAAGEVVERPASVVKELVENSIDAGATQIQIDIERGGHKSILIRDDGAGIVKDELALALSRHATSKIATLDDLEQILSLGFRGEALASISSVSRLTLTSKTETQSEAWQACTEGREMQVQVNPAAHPKGTSVMVDDLFFNTPARRKFLRSEKTEFTHIDEIVRRIALSRFDIAITLKHNGKIIRKYPTAKSQDPDLRRISSVCGKAFADTALTISSEYGHMQLQGWVAPSSELRTAPDLQYFYVNGRAMRDKLVNHALRQAYEESLADGMHPAYVVFLTLDAKEVDVNVHPAKHEVRFHQARQVHDFIVSAFRAAIDKAEPHPQHDYQHDYIRPLQVVNESTPTPFTGSYDKPVTFAQTPAKAPQYGGKTATGFNRQAGDNYQKLMQASEADGFQVTPLALNLWLINNQQDAKQYLIKPSALNAAKLEAHAKSQSCVPQPLLMPVALAGDRDFCRNAQQVGDALEYFGVGLDVLTKKVILKSVPAGQRELNWSDILSKLLAQTFVGTEQTQQAFLGIIKDLPSQPGQATQLVQWFSSLDATEQLEILDTWAKPLRDEHWEDFYAQL